LVDYIFIRYRAVFIFIWECTRLLPNEIYSVSVKYIFDYRVKFLRYTRTCSLNGRGRREIFFFFRIHWVISVSFRFVSLFTYSVSFRFSVYRFCFVSFRFAVFRFCFVSHFTLHVVPFFGLFFVLFSVFLFSRIHILFCFPWLMV
jgi:hypothetical protein